MHPVLAELADGVDGSDCVAVRVVALSFTSIDWAHSLSGSDSDQEHFAFACPSVGIQGVADTPFVIEQLPSAMGSTVTNLSAGCGKISS